MEGAEVQPGRGGLEGGVQPRGARPGSVPASRSAWWGRRASPRPAVSPPRRGRQLPLFRKRRDSLEGRRISKLRFPEPSPRDSETESKQTETPTSFPTPRGVFAPARDCPTRGPCSRPAMPCGPPRVGGKPGTQRGGGSWSPG
jgi:hypothetical protein